MWHTHIVFLFSFSCYALWQSLLSMWVNFLYPIFPSLLHLFLYPIFPSLTHFCILFSLVSHLFFNPIFPSLIFVFVSFSHICLCHAVIFRSLFSPTLVYWVCLISLLANVLVCYVEIDGYSHSAVEIVTRILQELGKERGPGTSSSTVLSSHGRYGC